VRALIICMVLAGTACQGDPPARFTSEQDDCSFTELSGWSASRERGSLLLRDDAGSRATIVVRSAAAEGDWVEPRNPALVDRAVRKVLASLPEARLSGPTPVTGELHGTSFDVIFVPRGKSQRYLRRHVVLYGKERVFHVVLTAPHPAAESGAKTLERIVDSFREEV
jgi:hypothetical protein